MKIFLDTAHIPAIRQWATLGIIDGVTLNPTHLAREHKNPLPIIQELTTLFPEGEISVQITEKLPDKVYEQAVAIACIAPNVVVKVPCHKDYYSVIKQLVQQGIAVNVTLVFALVQALYMSKLGVRYISPFVGRLDDNADDGIALIYELRNLIDTYNFSTYILAASLRHSSHVHDVVKAGVHAFTVTPDLLEKTVAHPLTEQGIALFDADWQQLKVHKFP